MPDQNPETELFCRNAPLLQKAWDNSSMSILKECPRKYQYAIIDGWVPKKSAAPLVFGSLLHRYLEAYDRRRLTGESHYDALCAIVSQALSETVRRVNGLVLPDGEVREVPEGTEGARQFLVFWSGDNNRTRKTLVRTIIWYTEQFSVSDPLKTVQLKSGHAALEISFRFMLSIKSPDGDPFLWCGHIDKICQFGNDLYLQERKHTTTTMGDYYFARYAIDSQTSGYLTAGKVLLEKPISGIIVDACQVAVTFSRVHRHLVPRTEAQLNEWLENTLEWINMAAYYIQRYGQRPWPMNESSCNKFSGCQFRPVCGRDPGVRQMVLEQDYLKRRWNPLEIRSSGEDT